MLKDNPRTSGV